MLYWGAVKREWAHPVRSFFFFVPLIAAMTLVLGRPLDMAAGEHQCASVGCTVISFINLVDCLCVLCAIVFFFHFFIGKGYTLSYSRLPFISSSLSLSLFINVVTLQDHTLS